MIYETISVSLRPEAIKTVKSSHLLSTSVKLVLGLIHNLLCFNPNASGQHLLDGFQQSKANKKGIHKALLLPDVEVGAC